MSCFQEIFCRLPGALRRHSLIKLILRVRPSLRLTEMRFNSVGRAMVDLRDAQARQCFRTRVFEPEFFEITSKLIRPGGVCFDVGANFGLCSFGLRALRPGEGIRFFLFEANPALVECLRLSRELNGSEEFQILHGCVLDREGFSSLVFEMEHTGGGHVGGDAAAGIPHLVLDQFIAENKVGRVDLMKLDIEGAEPRALRGARESLAAGRIESVYMEVSSENLQRQDFRPADCLLPLTDAGYKMFWCKAADFEAFPRVAGSSFQVAFPTGLLRLAPLGAFPENHQTDLLAVHPASPLHERIQAVVAGNGRS